MPRLIELWRVTWLYLAGGLVAIAVAYAATFAQRSAGERPAVLPRDHAALREMPPLPQPHDNMIQAMTPAAALAMNASVPFSSDPIEPAHSFSTGVDVADGPSKTAALECLTAAVYYEAAGEGEAGERAVAQVVLNRVRHPAFPSSICGVVYQGSDRSTGCQFTFTCDGSLANRPTELGWSAARRIARDALNGKVDPAVGTATHYHASYVVPYWAGELSKITAVGNHIFYRWPGYWGRRSAFRQAYRGEATPDRDFAAAELAEVEPVQPAYRLPTSSGLIPVADLALGKLPGKQLPIANSMVLLRADEKKGTLKIDEAAPFKSNEVPFVRGEQSPSIDLRLSGREEVIAGVGRRTVR